MIDKRNVRVYRPKAGPYFFNCLCCKGRNTLGVYVAGHCSERLYGSCQAGCGASYSVLNWNVTMERGSVNPAPTTRPESV